MPQNIYDQDDFFEKYITLDRQVKGLIGAPEWPRLEAMLPNLGGLAVLDLGCGFGWFSRYAREKGAASVRAIDFSEKMLDKAQAMTNDDGIQYERADLNMLKLAENEYDVVFSSLAFHYLADLPSLIQEISRSLRPSGHLIFSVEHPIYTAPSKPQSLTDEETGSIFWRLDDYDAEGLRMRNWLVTGVQKQHRTTETYVNLLLSNGLRLTDFAEWSSSREDLEMHPTWNKLPRPTFLLMGTMKS